METKAIKHDWVYNQSYILVWYPCYCIQILNFRLSFLNWPERDYFPNDFRIYKFKKKRGVLPRNASKRPTNETSEYDREIPVTDQPMERVSLTRKYQSQTNQWNKWVWPGNTSHRSTNKTSEYDQEIPATDQPMKQVSMTRKYQSKTNQWNKWVWPGKTSHIPTNGTSEFDQEIPVTDQPMKQVSLTRKCQSQICQLMKQVSMTRKYQSETYQWDKLVCPGNTRHRPTNEMSEYDQEIPVTDQTMKRVSMTKKCK